MINGRLDGAKQMAFAIGSVEIPGSEEAELALDGINAARETMDVSRVVEGAEGVEAAGAPVVIGENMARVNSYGQNVGGQTIDGWLAGRQWTQELNDEFIQAMRAEGRDVVDIGPDFGRRLRNRIDSSLGRPPSSIYGGERQQLLDYDRYRKVYGRTGVYEGGVPGLDF